MLDLIKTVVQSLIRIVVQSLIRIVVRYAGLQQRFAIALLYRHPQTFPLGILGVMFGVKKAVCGLAAALPYRHIKVL